MGSNQYDAFGNRTASTFQWRKPPSTCSIRPAWVDVVGEYASAGELTARYVYGLGLVTRQDSVTGSHSFYDFDGLGSTADLTDTSGQVSQPLCLYALWAKRCYPPASRRIRSSSLVSSGVINEGNGLLYMRARYYSNSNGRFIQLDPPRYLRRRP